MSERVSPSRLATYLTCPRQFEYDYEHELERDQTFDSDRYINRGDVLDTTLQQVADEVTPDTDAETVQRLAQEAFAEHWDSLTERRDYPSPQSYEYDRQVSRAAIAHYVDPETDGDGIRHLQYSAGTEVHLEWTDDDLGRMHGYADNIVRTDDGLLIIDYKASFSSSSFPNKNGSDLTNQIDGENHYPRRLKKWLQLGMYWTGLTHHDLYNMGDTIQFIFYGLINDRERTPTAEGYTVTVSGRPWDMTDLYRRQEEEIQTLVETAVTGIRNGGRDPSGDDWELIRDNACDDCSYRSACGDYITEEVQFS